MGGKNTGAEEIGSASLDQLKNWKGSGRSAAESSRKNKLLETRLRGRQVLDRGKPIEVLLFVSQEKDSRGLPKGDK